MRQAGFEQIKRITEYENKRNEATRLLDSKQFGGKLSGLLSALEAYYASDEWKQDFEADEAGLLPDYVKRGVLSEDGIYNLLERAKEEELEATAVYRDEHFVFGQKGGLPCIMTGEKEYILTCHPYEPCLYITDADGNTTVVHNAFDPSVVLDEFAKNNKVASITGYTYDAEDFCRMVEYAAGQGEITVSDAEKLFGDWKNREAEKPKDSLVKKLLRYLKKELMLTVSLAAAIAGMIITPPSKVLLSEIDWRTLGTLLMMLCVLEGFKQERVLRPLVRLASNLKTSVTLSLFLIFGVFFTSMFVTNDVSLIIFVPLTILIFRNAGTEQYILPVISMENIAAIRGSLLMPFGSPQNLFLYGQANISVWHFMLHMLPLCVTSAVLLVVFVLVMYRKNLREAVAVNEGEDATENNRVKKTAYIALFILIIGVIVTRTQYWYIALAVVLAGIALVDRKLFLKVDYVLIITFLCFFVFSSSITANPSIAGVLEKAVAGHEYQWAIGLSQLISNVPASIVLYPFSKNFAGLIYGADTAGLCSLIGSLASVINYRIYVREYPENGWKFIKTFTLISWAFFIIVVVPGWLLSKWNFF
ncbi:MAG: SLC13 family permease [Clostridiaceae bacterium]|nr:SLC13 family permease [Clostridiaceae bacterium]